MPLPVQSQQSTIHNASGQKKANTRIHWPPHIKIVQHILQLDPLKSSKKQPKPAQDCPSLLGPAVHCCAKSWLISRVAQGHLSAICRALAAALEWISAWLRLPFSTVKPSQRPGGPGGPGLSHSICSVPESRALLEQTPSPDFELLQGLLQFEALHVKDLIFIDVS